MPDALPFRIDANSYAALPERFHAALAPVPVIGPRLIRLNRDYLAGDFGIDPDNLDDQGWAALIAGNQVPENSTPVASAYAGHQFGGFTPQLGDGRAHILGDLRHRDGHLREVQLKGSGRTPFSRGGDGRAALGPVLREYLVSEAMAALGVPTTRALGAALTGEMVFREAPLPGAVLARVARSHVRVGSFQYFAARGDVEALRLLTDYVIARLYPGAQEADIPAFAMLEAVLESQAKLVAHWMSLGFIHGVMNTDNTALSGETIDYGPCAFIDTYRADQVFSSIDHLGRYAYENQPRIMAWNLARLAECLIPVAAGEDADDAALDKAVEQATAIVHGFKPAYDRHWLDLMRGKLGLETALEEDRALAEDLLKAMEQGGADFTLTFRALAEAADSDDAFTAAQDPAPLLAWLPRWRARLAAENRDPARNQAALSAALNNANPLYIPRNHRIEEAIAAAVENADFGPFERLHRVLAGPFEARAEAAGYETPPGPEQRVYQTFCGT